MRGLAHFVWVDVTDTETCWRMVHEGAEWLGGLEFAFNNAIDYWGRESAPAT